MMLEVKKKGYILGYLFLALMGVAILLFCSLFQKMEIPFQGEYAYSSFLKYHLTLPAWVLFCIAGVAIGYFSNLNPWYAGLSLFFVFPLTSMVEATVYRGSHNLIPFEFGMYFLYALPSIAAVYVGRFIFTQISQSKKD
jgi:hypothetical protein